VSTEDRGQRSESGEPKPPQPKFHDGGPLRLREGETVEAMLARTECTHTIIVDEGQRQLILKALASLSSLNPGWDSALATIALKFDNVLPTGRPQLYDDFRSGRFDPTQHFPKGRW